MLILDACTWTLLAWWDLVIVSCTGTKINPSTQYHTLHMSNTNSNDTHYHYSSLIPYHSSLITHLSSLITHHLSLVTCHLSLVTQQNYHCCIVYLTYMLVLDSHIVNCDSSWHATNKMSLRIGPHHFPGDPKFGILMSHTRYWPIRGSL